MVVPEALRVTRLTPGRLFCRIGDLSTSVGWKYAGVVSKLEDKRKKLGLQYYQRKKARTNLKAKAVASVAGNAKLATLNPILKSYGY